MQQLSNVSQDIHIKASLFAETPFSNLTTQLPEFTMVSSFRELLGIRPGSACTTDSALIIIDAQNEYASGQLKVTNAEASGKVIAEVLEKYRAANGKIVHVLHETPEGAPIFTPNTELAEEFENVKAKVNCFFFRSCQNHVGD